MFGSFFIMCGYRFNAFASVMEMVPESTPQTAASMTP